MAYGNGESELENSIEELVRYRALYRNFIAEHQTGEPSTHVTGRSLLVTNLKIAADDPPCTHKIVKQILERCCEAGPSLQDTKQAMGVEDDSSDGDDEDNDDDDDDDDNNIHMYDFVTELEEGEFDAVRLANVKAGFDALWAKLATDDL